MNDIGEFDLTKPLTPEQREHIRAMAEAFKDHEDDGIQMGARGALNFLAHIAALEKERDAAVEAAKREISTALLRESERDAALADNAAKDKAFGEYVSMYGVQHGDIPGTETSCPEDDTCECAHIVALNAAFGPSRPGAALLEEHRKALDEAIAKEREYRDQRIREVEVRARNEGRKQAEELCEAMAKEADQDREDASGGAEESEADGAGAALWTARNRIRAMTEPEPTEPA